MNILARELRDFREDEKREIFKDYNAFFEEGKSEGRSEEEVSRDLGDPMELAKNLREERRRNYRENEAQRDYARRDDYRSNDNGIVKLLIVVAALIFGFPLWIGLFATLFAFIVTAVALMGSGVLTIVVMSSAISLLTRIFLGTGLFAIGGLIALGTIKLVQLLFNLTRDIFRKI